MIIVSDRLKSNKQIRTELVPSDETGEFFDEYRIMVLPFVGEQRGLLFVAKLESDAGRSGRYAEWGTAGGLTF
jgi:hypothetical protein